MGSTRVIGMVRRWSPEVRYLAIVTAWGLLFLPLMLEELLIAIVAPWSIDFEIFSGAATLAWSGGDPYSLESCRDCAYRYSPLFAYLFAPMAFLGHTVWSILHYAAVFAFPFRIAKVIPLLWPFWWDVGVGSNLIFIALFGFYAIQGRRWAIVATIAVTLLVPRPLMIPLVVSILWQHPWARLPALSAGAGVIAHAYLTGHLGPWISVLAGSGSELWVPYNIGPSAIIGIAWIPVAVVVGAWLWFRGHVGLASLALSPYWLPYYLLMPLVDLRPMRTVTPPIGVSGPEAARQKVDTDRGLSQA